MPYIRQCKTADGRDKKTFGSFESAFAWATRMNKNPKFIHKQVAYKCDNCLKFHTGKSKYNTLLNHKVNIFENETN